MPETVFREILDYTLKGVKERGLIFNKIIYGFFDQEERDYELASVKLEYRFGHSRGTFSVIQDMSLRESALWIDPETVPEDSSPMNYNITDNIRLALIAKLKSNWLKPGDKVDSMQTLLSLPDEPTLNEHNLEYAMGFGFSRVAVTMQNQVDEKGQHVSVFISPTTHLLVPNGSETPTVFQATTENVGLYRNRTGPYKPVVDFMMDAAAGHHNDLIGRLMIEQSSLHKE